MQEKLVIAPFRRISPSRYTAVQACLLREVWACAGNNPLLPTAPQAELGSIGHRLVEMAGKGGLQNDEDKVNEEWDLMVSEAEKRMASFPLKRQQVPLSKSVPDYEVRRLRMCRLALDISRDAKRVESNTPAGAVRSSSQFEVWIESKDGRVGGYIDRVCMTPEGVVLRDYKSGAIFAPEYSASPGDIKNAYRTQLELYAALHQEMTEEWPIRLEIVPLQGEPHVVNYDTSHAQYLLKQAKAFLQTANKRIKAVQAGAAKPGDLASPHPKNCRLCVFRPACSAYWQAKMGQPEAKWPVDVHGRIQEFMRLHNGKIVLQIDVTGMAEPSTITVRGVTSSTFRHPALSKVKVGETISIYGLKHDYKSDDLIETNGTVIYMGECEDT